MACDLGYDLDNLMSFSKALHRRTRTCNYILTNDLQVLIARK